MNFPRIVSLLCCVCLTMLGCAFEKGGVDRSEIAGINGHDIQIIGNYLYNLGGTAVLLCGYGPGKKDVNRGYLIQNDHIHHAAQFYLHGPAFFIWQSGENKILNNYVHDLPYDAVVLSGIRPRFFGIMDPIKWKGYKIPTNIRENMPLIRRDEVGDSKVPADALKFAHSRNNLIQDNEFHNVMELLGDGNSICFSCAGNDNIVRRNLIYNSTKTPSEIHFDDDQEQGTVTENIIIGKGERLTYYNTNVHSTIYTSADKIKPVLGLGRPDYNLFYADDKEQGSEFVKMYKDLGHETHGLFADPGFVDLANGDLRFKADSPAHKLGIKQIDIDKIGLQSEPSFKRLKKIGFSTAVGLEPEHNN